jgi:ribonuclease R
VAEILTDETSILRQKYKELVPHLHQLHVMFKKLFAEREERGALDFDSVETRILFDKDKKIKKIVPTTRNVAHRIIEECMLLANVATARFLIKHKLPGLFRIHDNPPESKLKDVRAFLGEFGLNLRGKKTPKPKDYADILHQLGKRPEANLIRTVLLRSMSLSVYSPNNIGHFGLAYPAYTHFTSPIRRYPDLLIHRIIRQFLQQTQQGKNPVPAEWQTVEKLTVLGEHCSMTERRADEATRDVTNWLKCEYMQDKVGQVFNGIISGVTSFGLFIELKDIYVEGLAHITTLANDYYHFDAVQHHLSGERSGMVYRLGDSIDVCVAAVNLEDRKIDFAVLASDKKKTKKTIVKVSKSKQKKSGKKPKSKQKKGRRKP